MSKLAIIDGDALMYHSSKDSIHESIEIIDEKIQNIFIQTGATHYVLFISNSPYFRHKISPDYKSNRNKYKSPLKWLKTLKKYLIEEWGAQSMDLVEADDLCAYWYKNINSKLKKIDKEGFDEIILCSPDKDLLNSISSNN